MGTIFSITVAALLLYIAFIYNRLVTDKNTVLSSWSEIDLQLKRRHNLIPKLVNIVKQYTNIEDATLDNVTELRNQSINADDVKEKAGIELGISKGLHRFFVSIEDYPDLKANQPFLDLQYHLTEIENNIQYSLRNYNNAVRNLNMGVDTFPDVYISRFFNITASEYFKFDKDEK